MNYELAFDFLTFNFQETIENNTQLIIINIFMKMPQLDKTIFTKNRQLKFLIARKKRKFIQSEDR